MKTLLAILAATLLQISTTAIAEAADQKAPLKLTDGREFSDWTFVTQTPTTILIRSGTSAVVIDKKLLPPDLQQRYPIDPLAAEKAAQSLAAADQAEKARISELAARKKKEEAAQAKQAADEKTAAKKAAAAAEAVMDAMEKVVQARVEDHFKTKTRPGSGYTLTFDCKVRFETNREVPGWTGRHEMTGTVAFQYLDSKGSSFGAGSGKFTALVEETGGYRNGPKIVEFDGR